MHISPGTRLASYEITSLLGEGGMGQVYRAHDHRLGRDVALKILPEIFSHDPDRLARFEREARTLAALNHPNIAAIYGIEDAGPVQALVMELVPGRTLDERIRASVDGSAKLDFSEAAAIARAIAEALEAAHEAGIVHRDLKPANVKVRDDGVVKVLDFGLAKAADSLPTTEIAVLTSPAVTQAGLILGTAAYMAPEQARGKPIDKRVDVWAFGCVLYEMLTGRRLFDGETVSDVVAAVLTQPIDLGTLPNDTPPRVRELVARCLERDPKRRLRDIGEARIALDPSAESAVLASRAIESGVAAGTRQPPAESQRPSPRGVPVWAVAAIAIVAAGVVIAQRTMLQPAPRAADRLFLEIGPPPEGDFLVGSNAGGVVISPDGTTVAFMVRTGTGHRLFVRDLVTGVTRALPGTDDVSYPFWSPDSKKVGFFGTSKLLTIAIAGGLPEAVTDVQQGRGGTWSDTGLILFTPKGGGEVHRVSERGGVAEKITTLDAARGENAHYWPVALPGGRKFVFFVRSTTPENNGIYLGSVDGRTAPVRVMTALSSGFYTPPRPDGTPGKLLWVRDTELLAQAFDADTGALSGDVSTVATDVRVEESQRVPFASASNSGTIVWASARVSDVQLAWYDRTGRREGTLPVPPGRIYAPAVSPDGRRVAYTRAASGSADVMQLDIPSGQIRAITTGPGYDESARWSPDGRLVVYQGSVRGTGTVVIAAVDGSTPPSIVSNDPVTEVGDFMPDGKSVLIEFGRGKTIDDIGLIRLSKPEVVIPLSTDPAFERRPTPSPDGRWLALTMNRSGRPEVFLAPFTDDGTTAKLGEQRLQVSSGGGIDPTWRRDGKELLYLAADGMLMAVSISFSGAAIVPGRPTPLFAMRDAGQHSGLSWSADPDHRRFVVIEAPNAVGQRFRILTGWK